jgi:aldose 1-epimerase
VGYDHALLLNTPGREGLRDAAWLHCLANGLGLQLATTAPALQLYTGGDLGPRLLGKGRRPSVQAGGIALETQALLHRPPTVLRLGETYRQDLRVTFQTAALLP